MKEKQTTWQELELEQKSPLQENTTCQVLIVGGGITGIVTAYLLARAGKKVIVLEQRTLKETTTADTTAFLTYSLDTNVTDLKRIWGSTKAKQIIESHARAIERIEEIIKAESISCDFIRVPNYIFGNSKNQFSSLESDATALEKMGFPARLHRTSPLPFPTYGVLEIPNQAKFHPLAYCAALREKAQRYGAIFYERTKVLSVEGTEQVIAKTAAGTVTADSVIIATYNPVFQPWWYKFKKGMYVSYVYEASISKGMLPEALYEDEETPYHYFRIDRGDERDRLIIGGEDHRAELPMDTKQNFQALDDFLTKRLGITNYKLERNWVGKILEPSDGLPLIGRFSKEKPNWYVATAFSGNGMTYAHIAAEMLTALMQGKEHPLEGIYDPSRTLSAKGLAIKARDYTTEFFNGAVKNFFGSLFKKK